LGKKEEKSGFFQSVKVELSSEQKDNHLENQLNTEGNNFPAGHS